MGIVPQLPAPPALIFPAIRAGAGVSRVARRDFAKRRPDDFLVDAVTAQARIIAKQALHRVLCGCRGGRRWIGGRSRAVAVVIRREVFDDNRYFVGRDRHAAFDHVAHVVLPLAARQSRARDMRNLMAKRAARHRQVSALARRQVRAGAASCANNGAMAAPPMASITAAAASTQLRAACGIFILRP